MSRLRTHHKVATVISSLSFASAVYAACCLNEQSFDSGEGQTPCSGTSVVICDTGSHDANPGKTKNGTRAAVCTAWNVDAFCRCSCSEAPDGGGGWVNLGKISGTMCCWGYLPLAGDPVYLGFNVDKCIGVNCTGGIGEQ